MQGVISSFSLYLLFTTLPAFANGLPDNSKRLSGDEIKRAFANVRDNALVQDSAGTTAVNLWYEDGRFSNHWTDGSASGTITGSWYTENGQRCVIIYTGLAGANGNTRCSPVFRSGENYISVNEDGSIHGIHQLSPMTTADLSTESERE